MANRKKFYRNYSSANLIAVNLAAKQNVIYPATSAARYVNSTTIDSRGMAMPAVATAVVQLTVPKNDSAGWQTGIRRIYQQVRTANSGRINYQPDDMEKYVLNKRALVAIGAWLNKLYKATYTFRSTNAQYPRNIINGMGVDVDDIMRHAADLFMYMQRFNEQCYVSFPLKLPFFEYTQNLFEKVLKDSEIEKFSCYNFTMTQAHDIDQLTSGNGIAYYTSNGTSQNIQWTYHQTWYGRNDDNYWTYEDIVERCEEIKNDLLQDPIMGIIAGEIIKAYQKDSYQFPKAPDINSTLDFVYDEELLERLQNANCVATVGTALDTTSAGATIPCEGSLLFRRVSYVEAGLREGITEWLEPYLQVQETIVDDDTEPVLIASLSHEQSNEYLMNFHKDKIEPEDVMDVQRWIVTGSQNITSTENDRFRFNTFGTEVIYCVNAFISVDTSDNRDGQIDDANIDRVVPIAGRILLFSSATIDAQLPFISNVMFCWANFDWAPRFQFYVVDTNTADGIAWDSAELQILDWDTYAVTTTENMRQYFSYGNQSLLYAGASRNQNGSKTYGETSRNNKNKPPKNEGDGAGTK